jgi:hypothetical protein
MFREFKIKNAKVLINGQVNEGKGFIFISKLSRVSIGFYTELESFSSNYFVSNPYVDISGECENGMVFSCKRVIIRSIKHSFETNLDKFQLSLSDIELKLPDAKIWKRKKYYLKNARGRFNSSIKYEDYEIRLNFNPYKKPESGEFGVELEIISKVNEDLEKNFTLESDIFHLLKIALRTEIWGTYCESYNENDELVHIVAIDNSCDYEIHSTLIHWHAEDLLVFIKSSIPKWLEYKDYYGLERLVLYLWKSHTEKYIEIKFMLASVFLEALKFQWGLRNHEIKYKNGDKKNIIRGFEKKIKNGKKINLSFETLLKEVVEHLGIQEFDYDFIENRNCIIHSGMTNHSQKGANIIYPYFKEELDKITNQIEKIMLSILEYKGTIYKVGDVNNPVQFP